MALVMTQFLKLCRGYKTNWQYVFFSKMSKHFALPFIDPSQCQSLRVELKNNAFTSQGSRQGIFTLSSTENGHPSWTKSESQAQYTY